MCNSNNSILWLILIIKFIVLIIIPIFIVYCRIKDKKIKYFYVAEIIVLLLFIILKITGNSCIINSNYSYIKKNNAEIDYNDSRYSSDVNVVEKIITNDFYYNSLNKKIYYFNNDKLPLSAKKIECDNKEFYMKNYGNNITTISMLLSSLFDKNIDPIEILDFAQKKDLIDCENGVDTDKLLRAVADNYNLKIVFVSKENLITYLRSGGIVIAKTYSGQHKNIISCNNVTVLIYNIDNQNNFNLLNPSDKDYDYICPSNSAGYGQVIKAKRNDENYSLSEIDSFSYEFISLERN